MNRAAWVLAGLFVVLVVVLIFMFGDDEGDTSTVPGDTTTTLAETSSTPVATTAPDEGATTSTVEATTTTVGPTTTAGLEGNWAADPMVVAGFGALGWWDGTAWVQVEAGSELSLVGGESYQVARIGTQGIITGSEPTTLCEPVNNPGVVLEDEEVLGDFPGPYGVAISASWPLMPHLVEEIEDDGTYAAFAGELLAERGLTVADPVIKQLIRVDLQGDGVNEVLVVTEDVTEGLLAELGDYSIAFIRGTVQGDVQTTIIGESVVVSEDQLPLVNAFSIGAVADLSGDGTMEIVVSSAYYEGLGVEVWEWIDGDQGAAPQISASCGA